MAIQIKLVGFGDDKPARFDDNGRLNLEVNTPATVRDLLRSAGIVEAPDLIVIGPEEGEVLPRLGDASGDDHFREPAPVLVEGGDATEE